MKQSSKTNRRGTGRVAFLARIAVFQEKIEAGHTMASIYDDHKKELGVSYSQFSRYVNKFIRSNQRDEEQQPAIGKHPVSSSGEKPNEGAPKEKPAGGSKRKPGFHHNPDPKDRNDLI